MRRRITRTLIAAAAAGVTATTLGFTAASAAGAASTAATVKTPQHINPPSGGPPIFTPPCTSFQMVFDLGGCAGYVASGRNFRFAQSVITVPTAPTTTPDAEPIRLIGLGSVDNVAAAGIISCPVALHVFSFTCPVTVPATNYVAFAGTARAGAFLHVIFSPIPAVDGGDGVFFSVYYNQTGNELHFVISGPNVTGALGLNAHGAVYTVAVALADWSGSTPDTPVQPVSQNFRVGQFFQGRFTTANGQQGTFQGPWNLNPVEVTSNGHAPPFGTLVSAPSYLWTDGNSFQGLFGDAFGVWLYR